MTVWFLIFLDQICQKWIKLDQTFWPEKWLFGSNGFSAETAFRPKILLSNLKLLFGQKWFFWLEMAFFKWICLNSQSIERFGSPLMAESFQACFARNGFSAWNAIVKFEVAFWLEMAFFKWICLTSQSIERFGSPLMAESFQACFF